MQGRVTKSQCVCELWFGAEAIKKLLRCSWSAKAAKCWKFVSILQCVEGEVQRIATPVNKDRWSYNKQRIRTEWKTIGASWLKNKSGKNNNWQQTARYDEVNDVVERPALQEQRDSIWSISWGQLLQWRLFISSNDNRTTSLHLNFKTRIERNNAFYTFSYITYICTLYSWKNQSYSLFCT